ncbi:MAG: PAS domain S-box protein [Rhodocyclaceae bacterium]|nr:PAS domain S-box protein [Rhodocyclaceae bacterium]
MTKSLQVLLLEDEPVDAELIERELRKAGIDFVARRVDQREPFIRALGEFHPDLVLADYKLPGFSGLEALTIAREQSLGIPFIFVSGTMGEEFAIETLHQGAADYVLKNHLSKLAPAVNRALLMAGEQRRRKEAELDLMESEEKFRNMAESAQDGIVVVDQDGQVTYWNPAAERMFGYLQEAIVGRNLHNLIVPQRYHAAYHQGWPAFRRSGEGQIVGRVTEMVGMKQGGEEFPVELSISAAQVKGQWTAIGIIRDITERKAAERTLRQTNRFLKTLSRCNETLVHAENETALLQDMCRVVVEEGGFSAAWVGYVEHDPRKSIRVVAKSGANAERFLSALDLTWAEDARGQGPIGRLARSGIMQTLDDTAAAPVPAAWRELAIDCGIRSVIALPLQVEGQLLGGLVIYSAEVGTFSGDEIAPLTELAGDMAFGIATLRARVKQAESTRKLEKSLEATVQAIATTIEARDPYTAGHQKLVSRLAVAIGSEMGLSKDRLAGLQRGAEIHDIGKIYIPSEILNRPGRLSAIEFSLIKTHPEVGYQIIKDVDFPWPVADMILQHHERIDGSGYPHGLKGDEILLEARILAVADVVEAMMSHRPYRAALGIDAALEEIARSSERSLDRAAVESCVRLFRDLGFVLT